MNFTVQGSSEYFVYTLSPTRCRMILDILNRFPM